MKEKYEKKIKLDKELISAQPTNNQKNINKKIELLEKLESEYDTYKQNIKLKLEEYLMNYNKIKINPSINQIKKKLELEEQNIYLLNKLNTPFEKLGLDKICYNIRNYKDNNLEYINNNIFETIKIFKKIGIDLAAKDFNYSIFLNQYIVELMNNKNINDLTTLFEQLYWQSPNIINHIELNIKKLYLKHIKTFNKYILMKQLEVGSSITQLYEDYQKNKIKYETLTNEDTYINLENFKNKKLKISDYTEEKIQKYKSELSEGNPNELNFKNLLEDIIEYKNYEKFKFVLDEIKLIFNEKNKYKNSYKLKLKEIIKNEKLLQKLNNKYEKTKKEELKININNTLDKLNTFYIELEDSKFNEMVYKTLFDKSTISDALELASSYYVFFCKCIKKHELELNQDNEIIELRKFILDPANSIINTVNIIGNYDFPTLICEKNRLMHMLINEELLEENNVNNLIEKLSIILKAYDLKKIKIKVSEIETYINIINMLSNN